MKKVMLTVASMLFVGVMAVSAQVTQDTTRTGSTSTTQDDKMGTGSSSMNQDSTSTTGQTGTSGTGYGTTGAAGTTGTPSTTTDQADQKDMMVIETTDVPTELRTTLQGSEYSGWENGKLYRNKTTNDYTLEIGEGTAKKTYHFDKNGKKMDDQSPDNK